MFALTSLQGDDCMAIPITIKKKKMTLKSPDATRPDDSHPADDIEAEGAEASPAESVPDFSAPPLPVKAAGPSHALFGILAVVATLLFVVLVLMQWMEWKDLNTVFPRPIQTGEFTSPPV